MRKYVVGPAALEYDDQYYYNSGDSPAIEGISGIYDTKEEAETVLRTAVLKILRDPKQAYLYESATWEAYDTKPSTDLSKLSDDELWQWYLEKSSDGPFDGGIPEFYYILSYEAPNG